MKTCLVIYENLFEKGYRMVTPYKDEKDVINRVETCEQRLEEVVWDVASEEMSAYEILLYKRKCVCGNQMGNFEPFDSKCSICTYLK